MKSRPLQILSSLERFLDSSTQALKPSSSTEMPFSSADLLGQVNGEAVGIGKLECILAGKNAALFDAVQHLGKNVHTCVNGLCKALFLVEDKLLDVRALLVKLGVCGVVLVDNGVCIPRRGTAP